MNAPRGEALRRRAEIVRLVQGRRVRSQQTLQRLLHHRGFTVAQPTLSRDLKDLGLARTPTGYAAPPSPSPFVPGARRQAALDRALAQTALAVQASGTLVVLRTSVAAAHPLARALDEADLAGVVGSIAGDDTVFVAAVDASTARRLARRLRLPLARGGGRARR